VFGEPQLLEFENLKISCHANPDEYLTKIYGDYMQLPKEAERKGHFESTWGD
jgi:lipopolysaccharide cholinephosphotransferase